MEEIYFRDVVQFLWRSKWWVAGSTAIAMGIGAVMFVYAEPRYEITMTLVPADSSQGSFEQGGGTATSLASQFLGVSLGDRQAQKAQQFLALFRSPLVLERVDKELSLLPHLYKSNWDPVGQKWIEPDGWQARIRTMLRPDLPWVPPSLATAAKTLEKGMDVESTPPGSIVEVTFTDRDPAFGVALLTALYRESDAVLRDRARFQNEEHINYIQKSLSTVSYAETRQSLTTLLTAEVGQRVMINSSSPYAMEVLKPAFADPRPVSPSLTRYMLAAIAIGVLLGIATSGFVAALRNDRRTQRGKPKTVVDFKKAPVAHEA